MYPIFSAVLCFPIFSCKSNTTAEQASGLDFSRRGLVEVSSTVVDGKIDFLLVANLSRLGRDVGKMDAYLRWLEDWFVEVVCADGTVP